MSEFSREQIVDYIQRAIHARSGDDLERARAAFRGLSDAQMNEEYGHSGMTRREVLQQYERERALATACMAYIVGSEPCQ